MPLTSHPLPSWRRRRGGCLVVTGRGCRSVGGRRHGEDARCRRSVLGRGRPCQRDLCGDALLCGVVPGRDGRPGTALGLLRAGERTGGQGDQAEARSPVAADRVGEAGVVDVDTGGTGGFGRGGEHDADDTRVAGRLLVEHVHRGSACGDGGRLPAARGGLGRAGGGHQDGSRSRLAGYLLRAVRSLRPVGGVLAACLCGLLVVGGPVLRHPLTGLRRPERGDRPDLAHARRRNVRASQRVRRDGKRGETRRHGQDQDQRSDHGDTEFPGARGGAASSAVFQKRGEGSGHRHVFFSRGCRRPATSGGDVAEQAGNRRGPS